MKRLPISMRALWAVMLLGATTLALAASDTFSSSGNWTAPSGVTSITVEAWGGGGAGGGATGNPAQGGGGAGGQYASKVLTVTPGQSYAIVVGTGGTGGTGDGPAGGDSSFGATLVVAKGGAGGTGAANGVAGVGTTTGGVGTTVYAGGSGSAGSTSASGGAGGGGAGSGGAGGDASGRTAGIGTAAGGGNGGAGRNTNGSGNTGNAAGGGGGGAFAGSNTDRTGGNGAKGQVIITYAQTPGVTTNAATAMTPGGATFNGAVTSNGGATTVQFEYGLTTAYGSTITAAESPAPFDASGLAVTATVSGLSPSTTYHFRIKGFNAAGTAYGSDRTFTTSAPPTVLSMNRASFDPTKMGATVSWTVLFSTSVTGVDASDFLLVQSGGVTGASITSVTGSGTTWTVSVNTGTGVSGSLGLRLVDDDSIQSGGAALGGTGGGNGNATGQTYTLIASVCNGASSIIFCDDFERSNPGTVGNGWTVTPASAANCSGATGNTGCAGIDSDVPPFKTYSNPRPNSTRAMFTRWAIVSVDSPVVSLAGKAGAQLSFWIRRGRDTFSECPEASGENYLVQYYTSSNTWKTLAQYPSSPTAALCDGQIFTPTLELPADALHAGFRMRFYQPSGSGDAGAGGAPGVVGYDYWHMDDVVIREVTAPSYVGAFCDNFEAGLSRWSISAENYASGNIGDASIGTRAYQSATHSLDMRWGYVTASTFKTDLTGVTGNISFWIKSGSTTALDPVSGENLVVEYLNSSGVWTALNTYLGSVAVGTAYSATYALPADAKHAGFRLRFRKVSGGGYDKSYWHIDDVCVGDAVVNSDLALTKTGDATLVPGTNTSYTLKVVNNGPGALSGALQVVDTLPGGLTYLGATGAGWLCTANAQVVTCNWSGTLANGASAPDLVLTATIGAGVTGSITNTAVVTGTGNDPVLANNTASFTSGNFTPAFIFTSGACVDGIAIGQAGQSCSVANWDSLVAGQSKTGIHITAVNAASVPTRLSSSASTTISTQFGLTCHNPAVHAGVQAPFTAIAAAFPLCTGNGAEPTTWSSATNVIFAAGAPSSPSALTFTYADVGQIELYLRNASATSQKGTSGSFVVKPAGFVLSGIKCSTYAPGACATSVIASPGNNPAATTSGGLAFIPAGKAFSATVAALTVSGKTKSDAGTAINCTSIPTDCTPNFGNESPPESVGLDVSNAVAGMVAPPDLVGSFGSFTAGVASGSAFSWDEVGIITLTPAIKDGDYLGAGDVMGTVSASIGRFFPDHFNTVITQVAGVPLACPDGLCPASFNGMVYAAQPFTVTVTAKNANDATTRNYSVSAGFAKPTTLSPSGALGVAAAPSGAGALGVTTISAFALGTLTEGAETYTFTATPSSPTNIYIHATDGEATSRRATNPATTSVEGGVRVVSGRIKIPNVYGSERLQLPLTATVQYYDGNYWVTSLTDSVTAFNTQLSTAGGNLVATVRTGLAGGVTVVSPGISAVVSGVRTFVLAAPLANGSVDVSLNAPTYLPNAGARATFGVFKSPLIYRRENY